MQHGWTRISALVVTVGGLLFTAPAWAASGDVLVVRSTARNLPIGKVLGAGESIVLGAGEQALLVDDTGRKLTLNGRFEGRPAERFTGPATQASGAVATLGKLLQAREVLSAGVRSGDKSKFTKLPDPWLISVHDSGAACIRGQALTFWRAEKSRESKLTVLLGAGGRKANMPWAKDQDRVALPANLFTAGGSYKVELDTASAEFVVHQAPASAVSPVDQAVWMAAVGCKAQALSMLDSLN